ncbi:MAG TPA: hypothetical protein VGW78_01890 [Candidatus Babeliales bacterium]|nr:hypothetical protein [Candidatus Babeliales bacterium]
MGSDTLMSNRSNMWLSTMMLLVVVGLIGRGVYLLHTYDDIQQVKLL